MLADLKHNIKKVIEPILPPIILNFILWSYKKIFKRALNDYQFSGVYKDFQSVTSTNNVRKTWDTNAWIDLNKKKHDAIEKLNQNFDTGTGVSELDPYCLPIVTIINDLASNKKINILDFGGGSGNVYFSLKKFLTNKSNVNWHIVDAKPLQDLGRSYVKPGDNCFFYDSIENIGLKGFDIILTSSTLQYIESHNELLSNLLSYKPQYIFFLRLLASKEKKFITKQNVHGVNTPCHFIEIKNLINICNKFGYNNILTTRGQQQIGEFFDSNVPESLRVTHDSQLVFKLAV